MATVLLACTLAMSHNLADPDFWGHVQYGRDALEQGLPKTISYSYTAEGYRWINHENISEYLMALGANVPGPGGMLVIKSLLALTLMLLIYWQAARQGVSATPLYITMLLVACNLMHSWSLRPQLSTYVLFTWMIALLGWCFAEWPSSWSAFRRRAGGDAFDDSAWILSRKRLVWLWLLPPMFVAWANAHGGFVAGYCMLAAYLGGRSVEMLFVFRRRAFPLVALFAGVTAAAGLATLINPYGLVLHRWLLHALGTARPEILEWRPPEFFSLVWPTWWLMAGVTIAAVIATRRPRDLTHLALLALTMWQACEHRRHIAFFAILFGFWMPIHVDSLLARLRRRPTASPAAAGLSPRKRWALVGAMSIIIGLMSVKLITRFQQIPVRLDGYPVAAFQYINDQNLQGKLVVRFKWAQYAIAAFGDEAGERPHLDVAFDGRFRTCYPQEVVDMYFDFAIGDAPAEDRHRSPKSPPIDGSRILEFKTPNLVLIDRKQLFPVSIMQQHQDTWTLLYQDSLAQLWGRRDIYDNPNHAEYSVSLEAQHRRRRTDRCCGLASTAKAPGHYFTVGYRKRVVVAQAGSALVRMPSWWHAGSENSHAGRPGTRRPDRSVAKSRRRRSRTLDPKYSHPCP